jgi:hypothetical protein
MVGAGPCAAHKSGSFETVSKHSQEIAPSSQSCVRSETQSLMACAQAPHVQSTAQNRWELGTGHEDRPPLGLDEKIRAHLATAAVPG